MREIKFRAYDKSWEDEEYSGMRYDITDLEIIDGEITGVYIDGDYYDIKEVELMQYTGLKDKNGKEIYEGDLVKHEYDIKPYTVYFKEERGGYSPFANDGGCGCCCDCDTTSVEDIEVIGNIYDNPDLLEKGKEE